MYDDDDVLIERSEYDDGYDVSDRKIKVMKMLLIKMMKILLLIERSKC